MEESIESHYRSANHWAWLLEISEAAIKRAIKTGELVGKKIGRTVLIHRDAITDWISEYGVEAS